MFEHKFNSLQELMNHELKDLYDAEHRILETIPDMKASASSEKLKSLIDDLHRASEQQKQKIEQVFEKLGLTAEREACAAMKGIIKEAGHMIAAKGDDATGDAAIIGSINRIQHYEIAGFGTLKAFAEQLGKDDVAGLLGECLDTGYVLDDAASVLAESQVNVAAAN